MSIIGTYIINQCFEGSLSFLLYLFNLLNFSLSAISFIIFEKSVHDINDVFIFIFYFLLNSSFNIYLLSIQK